MQFNLKFKNRKKIAVGLLVFIFLAAAFLFWTNSVVQAGSANQMLWGGQASNFQTQSGLGSSDLRIVIARIIQIFLGFLGIIALLLILYAGWLWMSSGGDPAKIERAKKTITSAVIGLIIILLSFAIVTFILNRLLQATTGGPGTPTTPGGTGLGLGVLGGCSVASVYPEPGQKDVPRNTSLVVTFKEEINPTTICDDAHGDGDGVCDPGEYILPESVRIYKTSVGDACPAPCTGNILDVDVATTDDKTFVFTPRNYFGSPSEFIYYTVHLSNDIRKKDNHGAFDTCRTDYLEWQFEVSNRLDLTPPQVLSGGVFPPPDNARDTYSSTSAVAATGQITVNSQPKIYTAASFTSVTPSGPSPAATVVINPQCSASGNLTVAVMADGQTAQLSAGATLLGAAVFSGNRVIFPALLELTVSGSISAGNAWQINGVTAEVLADTLTVGNTVYTFVGAITGARQILRGASINSTAVNIAATLSSGADVNGTAVGSQVNLVAKVAGTAGNNIALATNSTALGITAMSGGTDLVMQVTVNDKRDKPKNTIIQINFNEAVNPLTLSGLSSDVASYIRVVDVSTGGNLTGKFIMSNQYQTVEFISDNLCGVNGCGEQIYCLPENSHLRVEIMAANLAGCINCAAKTPFTACVGGHCYDSATNQNYPQAKTPLDGVVDMALNSLDGNRSGDAQGPVTYYDENSPSSNGDNYQWSFFISDILDLTAPVINSIVPQHNDSNVSLAAPILIDFSKVMMASSLSTGEMTINNGHTSVVHKLINLWNAASRPVGYWVTAINIDNSPADGEPDWTEAEINHSLLPDSTSFRAQVGSGVKDIYQNCYNPSSGPGCVGTPSCCGQAIGIIPTAAGSCP